MYNFRTDLALERRDIYKKVNKLNEIDGVESTEEEINDFSFASINSIIECVKKHLKNKSDVINK